VLGPGALYDLIFMDPPYAALADAGGKRAVFAALAALAGTHLDNPGYLVLHAPRRLLSDEDFPATVTVALRHYGSTALWYVSRTADANA
jgi:16S rRNA G966 N2-methylase RsmD